MHQVMRSFACSMDCNILPVLLLTLLLLLLVVVGMLQVPSPGAGPMAPLAMAYHQLMPSSSYCSSCCCDGGGYFVRVSGYHLGSMLFSWIRYHAAPMLQMLPSWKTLSAGQAALQLGSSQAYAMPALQIPSRTTCPCTPPHACM